MGDRFIPSRTGAIDALSPASPLAVGWRSPGQPRRGAAVGRMESNLIASSDAAAALTWVVGSAVDSAGRPAPLVHAAVLRDEMLGGAARAAGGGGAPSVPSPPQGAPPVDVTGGWADVSLHAAPERVAEGSARHPAPPRLAAAAAAGAAAREAAARAAHLPGSPAPRGGGGGALLLSRVDAEEWEGAAAMAVAPAPAPVTPSRRAAALLTAALNTRPLDGTSLGGVSATAAAPGSAWAGEAGAPPPPPRVLQFGGGGENAPGGGARGGAASGAGRGALSALVGLGARAEALLASPPVAKRRVATVPYKVLDAPSLADDFYLNLLDWSSQNVVAVGLAADVYLWDGFTTSVTRLAQLPSGDTVTSVRWTGRGGHLAVGASGGLVTLWDATTTRELRRFRGHKKRVGVTAWAGPLLASGSRDNSIHLRDVRSKRPVEFRLEGGHKQEVCGLDFSPDGALLASGGNDNVLCVWDAARLCGGPGPGGEGGAGGASAALGAGAGGWSSDEEGLCGGGGEGGGGAGKRGPQPLFRFTKEANGGHCAAVKALAWCPHRSGLLASGGGTADKCIRFWNAATGHLTGAVDTGSQVCQLAWSPSSMELLSAHGYSTNTLVLWRFPSMSRVVTLTGHTFRVLYMTVAPDGESVCTGAGDETIRFWKVFSKPPWKAPGVGGVVSNVAQTATDEVPGGLAESQVAGGDLLRFGRERDGEAGGGAAGLLASPESYAVR